MTIPIVLLFTAITIIAVIMFQRKSSKNESEETSNEKED
jgi:preprotein translocase subunit SecG